MDIEEARSTIREAVRAVQAEGYTVTVGFEENSIFISGDVSDLIHSSRKSHVTVDQTYYLAYVYDYGPTTLEEFMAAFDVSRTTAERKLGGLVSQGKLALTKHKFNALSNKYSIPDTTNEEAEE